MIPSTIGWAIILSFLCEELGLGLGSTGGIGPWVLPALFLAFPLLQALLHPRLPLPNRERLPTGLQGLPIAVQTPHAFLPRMYYLGTNNNYYYVLDWEASVDPRSQPGSNIYDQTVDGLRRFYAFSHVVDSADFLAEHPRFLYLDQHENAWLDLRLRSNAQYKLTLIPRETPGLLPADSDGADVWLVERVDASKNN